MRHAQPRPVVAAKLLRRIRNPLIVRQDIQRLQGVLRAAYFRLYTRYHETRKSPGRIYTIPGRNCKMWLPISWGETVVQRRFGIFEPWTVEALERSVKPGMVVVELGACYGEFTIQLSRLVGPQGRVYSFEPFLKYFFILKRNVELNNLQNVHLLNQAVGPSSTREVYFDPETNHSYASLSQISNLDYFVRAAKLDITKTPTVKVQCVSLRNVLLQERLTMNYLFMDIEGCEIEVLKDVQELLCSSSQRPIIYLELHRVFYNRGDLEWLEGFFDSARYSREVVRGDYWLCTPQ